MSTWQQYKLIHNHYRDPSIAGTYDANRFGGVMGGFRNARVLRAVGRAMDYAATTGHPIESVLDLPVGTGRLLPLVLQRSVSFAGGDISMEMMQQAAAKLTASGKQDPFPFVQCNAETLPFADNTFDTTVTLRFMFHLPREMRVNILRELSRVSRRWVIIDCRNKWNPGFVIRKTKVRLGFSTPDRLFWSKKDIRSEISAAGLTMVRLFPTTPYLSDQWIVLAEKRSEDETIGDR